ncbi:MAG: ABC transporter ATP-binding protein/permease [Planctomycetaceae bacterium]|jgi:ATP-binding cassette subfamily B protein/subfamily B ATP-binding cassette protein MsbA|nr:ABC transporter ATP-binding protein/permease [Planctomycetaceae bacterium]
MNNLYRAIRKTFKYKGSIVLAMCCALGIGLLWGGNITIILPFIDLTFKGGNLHDWVDRQIEEQEKHKSELKKQIVLLEKNVPNDPKLIERNKKKIAQIQKQLFGFRGIETKIKLLKFASPYVNEWTPTDPFLTILLLIGFVLFGSTLKGALTIFHSILVSRISGLSITELRNDLYRKVLTHDPNEYSKSGIADAMSRLTGDVGSLSNGLGILYGKMIREPIKMIICLFGAAFISWQLLILTFIFVPLAAYLITWVAKSIKRTVRKSLEQGVQVFARLEESLRSIRIVRSFAAERFEFAKFRRTNMTSYRLGMKVAKYGSLTNPLTEVMGMLMISCAILAGAHIILHTPNSLFGLPTPAEPLTVQGLILFFALLAGAADPARKLSDIFQQFQAATAAADRVFGLMDRTPKVRDVDFPKRLKKYENQIEIEHVTFEYEPGRPVLKDVSLTLRFGETVAIVGPSGCGKSTLLSLIPRFADPTQGEIRIDGISLREIKMRDLYHITGMVSQEPILFNDTVYENIRYGTFDATEAEIIDAAKKANAHHFILNELQNGYETNVGPGGSLLSGGQRQRIVMARAILRNPGIFLLDEATSQIDMQSEKMIHDALKDFIGNRTTVIVTHRIGALALADRIVVMRDGVVEQIGAHEELLEKSPYYAKMNSVEN